MDDTQRAITALLVSPGRLPQRVDVPAGDARATLRYIEETVGRGFHFVRGFRKGLDFVLDEDVVRYFDEPPCRAVYATDFHVGKTVSLYGWDEDAHTIEKAGEVIGVVHGSFLVIARDLDEELRFVTRSMTDAEIARASEAFADESTGRLEELARSLGTIAA